MKLAVIKIPETGLALDETMAIEADGSSHPARVHLRADVMKVHKDVFIRGTIDESLTLTCARCLKDFTMEDTIGLDIALRPADPAEEMGAGESGELDAPGMNTDFYAEDEIDITEIVREQVVLSIPMKPLCSETCRGLCPTCGTNLNESTCSCPRESVDPRLKVLEKLLKKREE
jgi:uncharacterized protein